MKLLVALLLPFAAWATEGPKADPKPPGLQMDLPRTEAIGLSMMLDSKAVVGGIACHSPAAQAGMMSGDRIVAVAGRRVQSIRELRRALAHVKRRPSVEIVVRFGGNPERTLTVQLPPGWWQVPLAPDRH